MNEVLVHKGDTCLHSWSSFQECYPTTTKVYDTASYYGCKALTLGVLLNPHAITHEHTQRMLFQTSANLVTQNIVNKFCHGYSIFSFKNTASTVAHLGQLLLGHAANFFDHLHKGGFEIIRKELQTDKFSDVNKEFISSALTWVERHFTARGTEHLNVILSALKLIHFSVDKQARFENSYSRELLAHAAATSGSVTLLRQLAEAGYPLELRDSGGNSALHVAAFSGHSQVAFFLLEKGVEKEARNKFGETFVESALKNGRIDFVCQILTAGYTTQAREILDYAVKLNSEKLLLALKGAVSTEELQQAARKMSAESLFFEIDSNETIAVPPKTEL